MNPNSRFTVQMIVYSEYLQPYVDHGRRPVMICGCISDSGVGGSCQNWWWSNECRIVPSDFDPLCNTIWKQQLNSLVLYGNDPKYTAKAVVVYLDREREKTHTAEHFRSWTGLPRAHISKLLKDCWIILTENRTKSSQHPKWVVNNLQEAWITIPKD